MKTPITSWEKPVISVLHLEDSESDRELVWRYLIDYELATFRITSVSRLFDAKKLLDVEQKIFDLILVDLSLPDSIPNLTIISLLRHATNSTIVLLTGSIGDREALRYIDLGADDAICKGAFVRDALAFRLLLAHRRASRRRDREKIMTLKAKYAEVNNA